MTTALALALHLVAGQIIINHSQGSPTFSGTVTAASFVATTSVGFDYTSASGCAMRMRVGDTINWDLTAFHQSSEDGSGNILSTATLSSNGLTSVALAAPVISSVTHSFGGGATNWCYKLTCSSAAGESLPSSAVCDAAGWATLTGAHNEVINWTLVPGAVGCTVYRTTAGGVPNTVGKYMASTNLPQNIVSFTDIGTAGDTTVPPTVDNSGTVSVAAGQAVSFNGTAATDACRDDGSGNMVCTVAAGKTVTITDGNTAHAFTFGPATSPTETWTTGFMSLNGPVPFAFGSNGGFSTFWPVLGASVTSANYLIKGFSNTGTWINNSGGRVGIKIGDTSELDCSTSDCTIDQPATFTDGTASHAISITPGATPTISTGAAAGITVPALTLPSETVGSGSSVTSLCVSALGGCSMANTNTCTVACTGCTASSVCFHSAAANAATTDATGTQAVCAAGTVTITAKVGTTGTELFNVNCFN